jgi:DNA-binding transcriptional regulator YhcF (GntR family)
LYQQIAEAIRGRIESGELAPGNALTPLREAAEEWGVNIHTVRHAYAALARDGLVHTSRGAKGTRIAPIKAAASDRHQFDTALEAYLRCGEALGYSSEQLVDEVRRGSERSTSDRPAVYIVECSLWQCQLHAQELSSAWDVESIPWPLDNDEPAPEGLIVATYFHYNDIRRRWPHRLRDTQFVTVAPDAGMFARCDKLEGVDTLVLIEPDEPTAQSVLADIVAIPEASSWTIETLVTDDIASAVRSCKPNEAALLSPRVWASLNETTRALARAIEVRYRFDSNELEQLGITQRWEKAE